MKKYGKQCLSLTMCLLITLCTTFFFSPATAAANSSEMVLQSYGTNEVILLFDISSSMGLADDELLAPDALMQIVASLPSYWSIGLVTFNADVVDVVPPGTSSRIAVNTALSNISYTGSANPGAGLLQAAELFSDQALSRSIIFFTSNLCSESDIVENSTQLAEQAIRKIMADHIQVHIAMLGNSGEYFYETILILPQATNGQLFRYLAPEMLSTIADMFAANVFNVPRTLLPSIGVNRFNAQLPAEGLNAARVLIITQAAIGDITVEGTGGRHSMQIGRRFAVIEFLEPAGQEISVAVATDGNSIAYLLSEWDLQLITDSNANGLTIFWFSDTAGENAFLNPFFQQEFFPITVDGVMLHAANGYLTWETTAEMALHTLRTHLAHYGISIPISAEIPERVEMPSEFARLDPNLTDRETPYGADGRERNFDFVWVIVLIALVAALTALIIGFVIKRLISRTKKKTSKPAKEMSQQTFESNFKFSGKLNITIENSSGETLAQCNFEFDPHQKMSLQNILEDSGVFGGFQNAADVYLVDEQVSLQVINYSSTEISVGMNMLAEDQSHKIVYGESIILFDDAGNQLTVYPGFLYRSQR